MNSLFSDVITECKNLLDVLLSTKIVLVKRSGNVVARRFVRASFSYTDCNFINWGDVPTKLLPVLVTVFEI